MPAGCRRPQTAAPRVQRVPGTRSRPFSWPSAGETILPRPERDLLRLRLKFLLRRILRRLPAVTLVFPKNNPVVRCPTRGVRLFLKVAARARTRPQDDASPSAACVFGTGRIFRCDLLRPPASNNCVGFCVAFCVASSKRTLNGPRGRVGSNSSSAPAGLRPRTGAARVVDGGRKRRRGARPVASH